MNDIMLKNTLDMKSNNKFQLRKYQNSEKQVKNKKLKKI